MNLMYAVIIILVLAATIWFLRSEPFTSRADTIVDWFSTAKKPTYSAFKQDTGGNAVEYDDAMRLHAAGTLTSANMKSTLPAHMIDIVEGAAEIAADFLEIAII